MPTKKEIALNKKDWIKAIKHTIQVYDQCLKAESIKPYFDNAPGCAFCQLSLNLIAKRKTHISICEACIHYSPFSFGYHCTEQPRMSVIILNGTIVGWDKLGPAIKYRISFLIEMLTKLEKYESR